MQISKTAQEGFKSQSIDPDYITSEDIEVIDKLIERSSEFLDWLKSASSAFREVYEDIFLRRSIANAWETGIEEIRELQKSLLKAVSFYIM